MKKKVLAVLLTVAILSSLLVTAAGAVSVGNFTDVKSGSWYYEYVNNVTSKDYMIGVSSTKFAPEDNMTRAMFVTVLARVAGVEVNDSVSTFNDVPANTWYTGAVTWAANNEITYGVGNNNFAPNAFVTRQEMCTFMARFVEYYEKNHSVTHKDNNTVETFADASLIANWATSAINQCREWGLVVGYDNGNFGAYDFATRSQVAAVISRLDWMVKPTTSSSVETHTHDIKVSLTLPEGKTIFETNEFYLQSFGVGDNLDAAIKRLVTDDSNKNRITNWIESALDTKYANSFSKTETVTNKGVDYTITVTVDNKVISATVTAPMSVLFKSGMDTKALNVSDFAAGNKTSATDLLEMLNDDNIETNITIKDLATLQYIINEADKITNDKNDNKLSDEELTELITKKAPESVQSAAAGLTADQIRDAVAEQQKTITAIKEEVITNTINELKATQNVDDNDATVKYLSDLLKDNNTQVTAEDLGTKFENVDDTTFNIDNTVAKDSVEDVSGNVTISIDLGKYLTSAKDPTNAKRVEATKRLTEYLNKFGFANVDSCVSQLNTAITNALTSGVVKSEDDSPNLKITGTSEDIYNAISGFVSDVCSAYTTLNGTTASDTLTTCYTALLNDLVGKAESYGIDVSEYTDNIDTIATALATNSIHGLSEKSFETTVDAQTLYNKALNYANESENETVSGNIDKLPETVPAKVAGNYTVKIEIDPSAESDN